MQLINLSQNQVLVTGLVEAKSLLAKSRGLIGQKETTALYFKTRFGIHSFGMQYPLFVLLCDDQLRVRKLVQKVLPNRLLFWNPKWQHVFEFPIGNYAVTIGDKLKIIN